MNGGPYTDKSIHAPATPDAYGDDSRGRPGKRIGWQDGIYLLLLVLLVVGMAVRYTPNMTGEVAGMWWDPLLNIWTFHWDVTALLHDPLHLWQAPILYPNKLTLSYSENLLGEALLFAPFYLVTHNPVFAYNMVFYLTFLLCGVNMYILARYYTGRAFPSFIAALIYAFAPYRLSQIDHIHVLAGEWIPLAFLFLDRALKERRWRFWILFGVFYLLQMLSSVYYGIYLTYTLLAYLLIRYARPCWRAWRQFGRVYLARLAREAVRPAIVCGTVLLVLAVLMTPYLLSLGSGLSRGVDQSEQFSAFIRDFTFTAPFNWLYGISSFNGVVLRNDSEHYLFLGVATMVLAATGIFLLLRKRDGVMHPYVWTALVVLLFSLGPVLQYATSYGAPYISGYPIPPFQHPYAPAIPMPWLLAYFILPGFKGLRVPARLTGVLLMFLALFAAYAVSFVCAWGEKVGWGNRATFPISLVKIHNVVPTLMWWIAHGLLLVLPMLLLLEAYPNPTTFPVTVVPTGRDIPQVYQWLATHGGDAPVVELPMAYLDINVTSSTEAWYDYYSMYHGHPIVNGWSGYRPQLTTAIAGALLSFPSPHSVAVLKHYHIIYVVVHPQLYPVPDLAPQMTEMRANLNLQLVAQFGAESIWEVD